jgi:hypothetical protein
MEIDPAFHVRIVEQVFWCNFENQPDRSREKFFCSKSTMVSLLIMQAIERYMDLLCGSLH